VGGVLAALSYAGTTLLARFAVPRYGPARVLFLEIAGGVCILFLGLLFAGRFPDRPQTVDAWAYIVMLAAGTVLAANVLFFNASKRIDAAPTAVAATIEPVVAALLALALFGQRLSLTGWAGLLMVVAGVAGGYLEEAQSTEQAAP
jgi:DME family drug/metabolite transporter